MRCLPLLGLAALTSTLTTSAAFAETELQNNTPTLDSYSGDVGAELLYFYYPVDPSWGVYPTAALQWNLFVHPR